MKFNVLCIIGSALKITKHSLPDIWSSCHRITADVLKIEDIENYLAGTETTEIDSALIGADYAIINVYRMSGQGALINYDLHLGDSTICRVTNNFCKSIKINKDGLNSLWAKTETKSEVPINIESGNVYYIRCSVSMGAFAGRPKVENPNCLSAILTKKFSLILDLPLMAGGNIGQQRRQAECLTN
ncbi:MAG: DUF2846 domain-containing protein, partial [Tannerella sp.]|nr:DUF2846 domain-containing protein [Tannerella sp.]